MRFLLKIIQDRNFILISALVLAFIFPNFAKYFKEYTIYILGVVMTFSTTGIKFRMLKDLESVLKVTIESVILNYVLHGIVLLSVAYLFFKGEMFYGFVVIAATPPGVAIIPFSYAFKGDLDYSFKGILGSYLISIFLTPLIISLFAGDASLDPVLIVSVIAKTIVIPIVLSRLLLIKKIYPTTEKIRGKVVDWGFALIIYTAIAINRDILFSDWIYVAKITGILIIPIFLTGIFFLFITRKNKNKELQISKNLMLTIKSSGFAIAVTLILFDQKSAVPATIMSILVLIWLISLNIYYSRKNKTI